MGGEVKSTKMEENQVKRYGAEPCHHLHTFIATTVLITQSVL